MRGLAPACPLSVLCSFSIALWGIRGHTVPLGKGADSALGEPRFARRNGSRYFDHHGITAAHRRLVAPLATQGGVYGLHRGCPTRGVGKRARIQEFSKKKGKNSGKKSRNIGQNRGLLTRTISTITTRFFFLFLFFMSISVTVSFQRTKL